MFRIKAVQMPSLLEAVLVTATIIIIINISILRFDTAPHIPLILSVLFLIVYGLIKGVSYKTLEKGLTDGAIVGIAATFLFFFIGMLIAAWMMAGTIPTLIYVGFEIVTRSEEHTSELQS